MLVSAYIAAGVWTRIETILLASLMTAWTCPWSHERRIRDSNS